ncbi:caleosin family protein [Pendulispora brunnea]|uniref:Caleosin family protein n=1 Tax=Pendulispora brunnea TaxID=2905690 RepID=A0ABZ2KLH4_9BACT
MTPLQTHVSFFDPEGTGVITLGQTFRGLSRIGVSWALALVLTPIINGFLGYLTTGKPGFKVHIDRIAQGKHPFDTGGFDDAGNFDRAAFDALFSGISGDVLTVVEMRKVIASRGNRRPQMGPLAASLGNWFSDKEVRLLFCVASDTSKLENGVKVPAMRKRTVQRFFEGTLLHDVARARVWRRH